MYPASLVLCIFISFAWYQLYLYTILLIYFYIFISLAAQGLSCSMWGLVTQPGIEPGPHALGVQVLHFSLALEVSSILFSILVFSLLIL